MSKEELRDKLLEAKEVYVNEHKDRLETIKPKWDEVQANKPNVRDLDPVLEFCTNKSSQDLWWYGRVTISSAPLMGEVGRRFHYLLRDKNTGFILAMVGLASDLNIPIRDKHIGWDRQAMWKDKKINYLMNIAHCVSVPEFGPHLVGKLAALSTKSKEVQDCFVSRYKHPLAAMSVTSLFGKSSMYNRLDGFVYLGKTKGCSPVLVPREIKIQMREDYKREKGKYSETYVKEDGTVVNYGVCKAYQKLGKYVDNLTRVENMRGVYFVPLAENWKDFLCSRSDELILTERKEFDIIKSEWESRWFLPRLERMGV